MNHCALGLANPVALHDSYALGPVLELVQVIEELVSVFCYFKKPLLQVFYLDISLAAPAIGDAFTRYKRMRGFNVLYPMGYDALGLPAENAAIKNNSNPKDWTERSIGLMKEQQKLLGLSYDWDRLTSTCNPEYYKWNQS